MKNHITFLCCLLAFSKGYAKPAETKSSPDIVDGEDAKPGQFPFQISMQLVNAHFCGGSVLNENYILTASHCTKDFNDTTKDFITVVAGTINVKEPQQRRKVEKIIQHEEYDPAENHNDICLVKLDRPLQLNSQVQPTKLPVAHSPVPTGSTVQVSGWGGLGGEEDLKPTILQDTTITVADQDYCVKVMKDLRKVYSSEFCANNPHKRQGECKGDSGGPVTLKGIQVGIVSWSYKDPYCASTVYPSVFTKVPEYIDWITKHAV